MSKAHESLLVGFSRSCFLMAFSLLNASLTANAAISVAPIMKTVIAMSTIQSNPPEIERAATQQTYLFVGYIFLLLLTAAASVFLYRAGNRYQDAVKKDADARIAEAQRVVSEADAKAAEANLGAAKANEGLAKSNEEIARLTKEAEALRAEAEQAKAETAKASKIAATANERAGELELRAQELAKQNLATESRLEEERRARLATEEALAPRILTGKVPSNFSSFRDIPLMFLTVEDSEARRLTDLFRGQLVWVQWQSRAEYTPAWEQPTEGVTIEVPNPPADDKILDASLALFEYLESENIETTVDFTREHPKGILIRVGLKPITHFIPGESQYKDVRKAQREDIKQQLKAIIEARKIRRRLNLPE